MLALGGVSVSLLDISVGRALRLRQYHGEFQASIPKHSRYSVRCDLRQHLGAGDRLHRNRVERGHRLAKRQRRQSVVCRLDEAGNHRRDEAGNHCPASWITLRPPLQTQPRLEHATLR